MADTPRVPDSRAHPVKRGQAAKTIAIWVVLIVMWMAIYQMVGGKNGHGTWIIAGVIFAVFLLLFVVLVARASRQLRRFNPENTEAVAALGRGDLVAARQTFWRWAEETSVARIAAVARHNLGWTLARQGELAQAIEVTSGTEERYLSSLQVVGLGPTSAVDMGLYHALANNLDEARRWLGIADSRASMVALPSVPAMRAFAQAVIDCRSGRAADAVQALDARWSEYEALLTGDIVRPLRVLRAFARSATGPREAGTAEMDLVSARPVFPREYAMLESGWPEMATFLAAHNLAG